MIIDQKLTALRTEMKNNGISAVIIPTADRHQSEYVPTCWMDREWISGFTGSAGIAVVTLDHAGLWTDSRYFIQAEDELDNSEFKLHKQINRARPEHLEWLVGQLSEEDVIAVNGWNFTKGQSKQLHKYFSPKNIEVCNLDLISLIWDDRPSPSSAKIEQLAIKYSGVSSSVKINKVRKCMKEKGADIYVITALDEIAWLTNLRGSDVDYNPIFISYAVLNFDDCLLFVDESKIPDDIKAALNEQGVSLRPYESIEGYLHDHTKNQTIIYDPSLINTILDGAIQGEAIESESIIGNLKGIKNEVELTNWKNAMVKDGVALTHAFYWLEQTLLERKVSEVEFAQKIAESRAKQDGYKGESFGAIVGYNANGAIIHYHPQEGKCKMIENHGILLCDSGAQYVDGTTDITRTIALSEPSKNMKKHFTLVLKGMISLTKAIFPKGTTGGQLDILARQHLWSRGLDFGHGTGHGVGFYLNVHEGPQGFAPINTSRGKKPIEVGMVTSNEPGYYINNEYGIRIENLIVAKESSHEGFLCFETMALFPIDQALMEETNLDAGEKAWLNNYHFNVFQELSPYLEEETKNWLQRKCKPLN